jgi:tetratricopeptide (TPR) repeat protein
MNRLCNILLVLAACLLAWPALAGDEAEIYFRGYTTFNEGERLEKSGDLDLALSKFQQADEIFDNVVRTYPNWEPNMIDMRRQRVQDAIRRVESRLARQTSNPAPAPAPAAATQGAPIPSQPVGPGTSFAPTPAIPTPGALSPQAPAAGGALPSLQDMFRQWEESYRQRLRVLESENYKNQEDLRKWQDWYQWASQEITTVRGERDQLNAKAAQLDKDIDTLRKNAAAGTAAQGQLDALLRDKAALTAEIQKKNQKLAAAEKAAADASTKLVATSAKLEKVEADLKKVTSERDALAAQNMGLKAENDALRKTKSADKIDALIAENERLKKDLEAARLQTEALKGDIERKDQEIAALKTELSGLKTELTTLRQESARYQTQVAELTMQLKQLQSGETPAANPALAKENDMLREIIMRQLRTQYRQQRAKELVIAELQKMENASEDLIKQVEDLEGERMVLTPEEEKLFTDPKVREILGQTGIQATLVARSEAPDKEDGGKKGEAKPAKMEKADDNSFDAILSQANEALQNRKYGDAAKLYQDALRAEPKSASALIGLGLAHQRSGNYAEAEASLQKCLTFEPDNANASYALGVTLFKQERWNDSLKPFERSLEINPKNAGARHFLGIVATKLNLLTRAEREFKTALAIDPNYGEAFFNLAVLYITWNPPQWDKAREAYDSALSKGVASDAALEKLLKSQKTASAN